MNYEEYKEIQKRIKGKIQEFRNLDFRKLQYKNLDEEDIKLLLKVYFDPRYLFLDELEKLLQRHTAEEVEELITETAKRDIVRVVKCYRQGFSREDKRPSIQDNFVLTDSIRFSINRNIASQIKTYQEAIIWKNIAVETVEKYDTELKQRWRTLKEQLKEKFQYDEYETGPFGNGRYAIVKEKMRKFLYLYEYISKGRGIARVWFFRDNRERIEFKKDVSKGVSDIMTKINKEIIKKLEEVKE